MTNLQTLLDRKDQYRWIMTANGDYKLWHKSGAFPHCRLVRHYFFRRPEHVRNFIDDLLFDEMYDLVGESTARALFKKYRVYQERLAKEGEESKKLAKELEANRNSPNYRDPILNILEGR